MSFAFILIFVQIKFICHNIYPFKVYKLVFFGGLTKLCTHTTSRTFHHLRKKTLPVSRCSPFPLPCAPGNHLLYFSISVDLPTLDISCLICGIRGLLYLASLR